jgi:GT2 family glycosyltransferase
MDERFFMYYEEVDLCYRIKQAGWRIVFNPEATITHLGGCSSGQIPVETRIMVLTSLLKFFRKHRGGFATGVFNCVFKPAVILRDICNLAVGSVTYIFAALELNKRRCEKAAAKVKNSAILLWKYSWQLLFRI